MDIHVLDQIVDEVDAQYNQSGKPDVYIKGIFRLIAFWIRCQLTKDPIGVPQAKRTR